MNISREEIKLQFSSNEEQFWCWCLINYASLAVSSDFSFSLSLSLSLSRCQEALMHRLHARARPFKLLSTEWLEECRDSLRNYSLCECYSCRLSARLFLPIFFWRIFVQSAITRPMTNLRFWHWECFSIAFERQHSFIKQ